MERELEYRGRCSDFPCVSFKCSHMIMSMAIVAEGLEILSNGMKKCLKPSSKESVVFRTLHILGKLFYRKEQ